MLRGVICSLGSFATEFDLVWSKNFGSLFEEDEQGIVDFLVACYKFGYWGLNLRLLGSHS